MDLLMKAKDLAERVEAEATKAKCPVAVCVMDIHGNLVLQHRMNGAPAFSLVISERKAYTAALVGMRTADLYALVQPGQPLYVLPSVAGGRFCPMGGGVPLTDLGHRYVHLLTEPTTSALFRVVVHEAPHFPQIGRVFNETGPRAAKQRLADYLGRCIDQGKLEIADTPMAVEQFLMLCQAGFMQEFLFGVRGAPTEQEIETSVKAAVSTFLAAYATDRCD